MDAPGLMRAIPRPPIIVYQRAHRSCFSRGDEPATGLDVGGRRALLESVLEVVHEPERSVIVSSMPDDGL